MTITQCPDCDSTNIVTTTIVDYEFDYGFNKDMVVLKCTIPVDKCIDCHSETCGEEASQIMHDTVQKHLESRSQK